MFITTHELSTLAHQIIYVICVLPLLKLAVLENEISTQTG